MSSPFCSYVFVAAVGLAVGIALGIALGTALGTAVGITVGPAVGTVDSIDAVEVKIRTTMAHNRRIADSPSLGNGKIREVAKTF
jgi:hypothetical protein